MFFNKWFLSNIDYHSSLIDNAYFIQQNYVFFIVLLFSNHALTKRFFYDFVIIMEIFNDNFFLDYKDFPFDLKSKIDDLKKRDINEADTSEIGRAINRIITLDSFSNNNYRNTR